MIATGLITGLLIWLLRAQNQSTFPAWLLGAGTLVVSVLTALTAYAPRKIEQATALSRIDVGWKLNHRLISAWQGIGEWPPLPKDMSLPVQIRFQHLLPPCLGVGVFLALAAVMPLPKPASPTTFQRIEPPDWTAVESFTDELEKQEIVDEDALKSLRNELEQLRAKPMKEWYDPSTLEATDRMRSRVRNDSERLMQAMNSTSALLALVDQGRDQLMNPQQQAMQDYLEQMLEQMGQEGFQLNQEMLNQLQQVDLSQLQQIDPQQLQELEARLMEQGQAMEQALIAAGIIQGFGDQPGAGGLSRGGGPADLTLKDFEPIAQPVIPMALEPGNLENARIGDLLELRDTEHEDERETISQSAGTLRSTGGSGEVVWQQDILPDEENVLKEFFK